MMKSESSSIDSFFNPIALPLLTGEYEVFLSFRGLDIRHTFADCLYSCLVRAKIRTFRDEEELPKGETLGPSLVKAITESKIYIPIFTEKYASSKWCLQEPAKMVECWKTGKGHIILPIFYLMDPRDVRHQEEAFEQHNLKHDPMTVKEWKEALEVVGDMKGWHVTKSDGQGAIIDHVFTKVELHLRAIYTLMTDELVGIDFHVEQVVKLLNLGSTSEKFVGIHGMGGFGKTTLAKAVYNKIFTQFDHCCFLENVRETLSKNDGIVNMQNKVISNILRSGSSQARNASDGIQVIKDRVCKHKLLIVLDDIDERFNFDEILGKSEIFSIDSRFLVTTRDGRITQNNEFWMHDHVRDLGQAIVRKENYQNPHKRSRVWSNRDALDMLTNGEGSDHVEALRVDLEGIDEELTNHEFKKLSSLRYLEVWNGRLVGNFKGVLPNLCWLRLHRCDSVPTDLNLKKTVILGLEDCSLSDGWRGWNQIKVAGKLKVVNLTWSYDFKKVPDLTSCRGLELLDFSECRQMRGELDIGNFKNLRLLGARKTQITRLKGEIGMLQNLQKIDVGGSSLVEIPVGISKLTSLESLDLVLTDSRKPQLTEMLPNGLKSLAISSFSLSALPSSLTCINLHYCEHMQRLPNLTNLNKLTRLHMYEIGIREIPGLGELKVLQTLLITDAPNLENLDGLENVLLLAELSVRSCCILGEIPSLANLTKLQKLSIVRCGLLTEIHGLGESLSYLAIRWCCSLGDIGALDSIVKLETLILTQVQLRKLLPPSLSMLTKLRSLTIEEGDCRNQIPLTAFPDLSDLTNLRELEIQSCKELTEVTGFNRLESLELLVIWRCSSLRKLSNLSGLRKLNKLDLSGCMQLTDVIGIDRLESLEDLCMYGCESVKELPNLSGLKNLRLFNQRKYTQ
ncbi:Disease resistance protein L6 [Linum perenne]